MFLGFKVAAKKSKSGTDYYFQYSNSFVFGLKRLLGATPNKVPNILKSTVNTKKISVNII